MAGEATIATSSAIIKTLYPSGEVPAELFKNNPSLAMIDNPQDFEGDPEVVPLQTEATWGASAQITNAQSNLKPSNFVKFAVSKIEDFSLARVTGQAMRAVRMKAGAMVNLWEEEMKSAMHQNLRSAAIMMHRTVGSGTRGQISSGYQSTTLTLGTTSDIANFGIGMTIGAVSSDALSATVRTGALAITAVDRAAGTITIASQWDSTITTAGATDWIVRDGDAHNSGVARMMVGTQGWIPGGTTPGTLWGLSRNTDPVRLAGQNFSVSGYTMEEAIIEAAARVSEQGNDPDTIVCHPRDRAQLVKSLTSKVNYDRVASNKAGIGFRTLEVEGNNGVMRVIADINFPRQKFLCTVWDTWKWHSLGPAPQILDFDGETFLRVYNADAYECRVGYYANTICTMPVASAIGTSWGA